MTASRKTAEQVVETFRQAAEANRATRCRAGNVIQLGPETADDVLVTGDLHGCRETFERLCELADLAARARRHLVMQEVCHGGPMSPSGTGCLSHLLLEETARLKAEFPEQFHFLPGNHELAELTDFPIVKSRRILNVSYRCGLEESYGDRSEQVRLASLEFIRTCPLAVRLSNGVFISHSLPEGTDIDGFDTTIFDREIEQRDLDRGGAVFRLLWGRDYRPENAAAFARLVGANVLVHGHEPCEQGFATPNPTQIILDSCSQRPCYLIVPLDQQLTQQQLVERIQTID